MSNETVTVAEWNEQVAYSIDLRMRIARLKRVLRRIKNEPISDKSPKLVRAWAAHAIAEDSSAQELNSEMISDGKTVKKAEPAAQPASGSV